jgi:hypothetical protein
LGKVAVRKKTMDWKRLEEAFAKQAERAVAKVMREHPRHTFYGLALHESYRELDGQITLPWVALNSVESLSARDGAGAAYDYNPADWRWSEIRFDTKEISRLTAMLQEEANRSTQNHWRRTEQQFLATMVRVAKRLYAAFRDHPQTTGDFFACFWDEQEDLDLLRKSMPKRLYLKHFGHAEAAEQRRREEAASPTSRKLARYMEDLWEYQDEIMSQGEAAVDSLIVGLKDPDDGWQAANLLGRIGIADARVIRALRREVRNSTPAAGWSASALGMLADSEYLLKLADDDATRENAIRGLAAPLRSWANEAAMPIPLDYRPLESLLAKKCPKCNRVTKEELRPGVSFCDIKTTDVDEAIRGLQSPHVIIRQHAVCVLGERSLGKPAAKTVLPALVNTLRDRHPNVRRLAILSLRDWKAAARPCLPEIRKLLKDKDPDVRYAARDALS